MTLKKQIILCIVFIFNSSIYSQEIFQKEHIQIGKFKYIFGISEAYSYEENINIINFELSLRNKYQLMATKITYRMPNSSSNYNFKVDESHPPDQRASYKDGIILSVGELKIDFTQRTITTIEKYLYKDTETIPDISISLYKQKRNGFFEVVKITDVFNGIENVVFKK